MLRAHLGAEEPVETEPGCPEDGGAGPHPERVAGRSPEDGRAEDMLRLQQEVSGLREEFRKQEARWAATHRELQAQMDALVKQNLELWAGLRALEPRRLEAKQSAAGLVHVSKSAFGKMSPLPADTGITPKHAGRSCSAALLGLPSGKPIRRETQKTDSGKPIPCEDGDKALSRSLQDRHAKPPGRKQASEEKPALSEDGKVLQQSPQSLQKRSGRGSPVPAALAVAPQDHRAKDPGGASDEEPVRQCRRDTCSLSSGSHAGRLPARVPTDEPTWSPPSTSEDSQDLPVEPELPPNASQPGDTKIKQEEEGEVQHPKDKGGQALSHSCKTDTFSKGTEKDLRADRKSTTPRCSSWDMKESPRDSRLTHSAGAWTAHAAHCCPLEVGRVPNKQTEKVCPDGAKEIVFPDGTVQRLNDGREETVFPDGTIVSVERNGDKTIMLSNGQREIHTAQFKRREYPDGTTRTVYHDGHQETKDASGRVRVRDEAGNIILDRK